MLPLPSSRMHFQAKTDPYLGRLQAPPKSPICMQCGVRVADPPRERESTNRKSSSNRERSGKRLNQGLEVLDDALIRDFAYKLHRMLCGNSQILGLYFIAPTDVLSKHGSSFETILKALMLDRTTTAKANSTFYLATISLSTGAISALRYVFSDKNRSVSPESIHLKVTISPASELVRVRTNWKLDLLLPVKRSIAGEQEHRFHKTAIKVLTDEINKIEAAVVVDVDTETIMQDDDEDGSAPPLLKPANATNLKLPELVADIESSKHPTTKPSSRKRTKSAKVESHVEQIDEEVNAAPSERRYRLFSRHLGPSEANSFVVHQVASGALRIRGVIEGVAHVYRNELESSSARSLRLDLVKSLQSRMGLLFDRIDANSHSSGFSEEDADKTSMGRAKSFSVQLPRRVLLSSLVQQASFCDYVLPNESLEESKSRLRSLLGMEDEQIDVEELERAPAAGDSTWNTDELSDHPSDATSPSQNSETVPSIETHVFHSQRSFLWVFLVLVGIVAALVSALVLDPTSPFSISPSGSSNRKTH